jgi:cephalosporin-C deacetylase-like acetyl esterase
MKNGLLAIVCVCVLPVEADLWIEGTTDRPPLDYRRGEPMVFTLTLKGDDTQASAGEILWERTGDDGRVITGRGSAAAPVVVKTALDRPGFVRVYAEVVETGGDFRAHDDLKSKAGVVFFDGGAAAEPKSLQPARPEPSDFDDFWARRKAELAAVPMVATRTAVDSPDPEVHLYALSVTCAGPRPATGYLSIPKKPGTYPGVMTFWGYGSSWGKAATRPPEKVARDEIRIVLSAHGFELGREASYYTAFRKSVSKNGHGHAFDPDENAKPETAYFGGMSWRVMRALEYLKSLPEWNGRDLTVTGGSQGALQALWGAALVPGVTAANISIPWCCDVGGPAAGRNHGTWYPAWAPGLDYYDQVHMARRVPRTCHVTIGRVGLGDYIAPPCGAVILYNRLYCPKSITWVQGSTHLHVPPKAQRMTWRDAPQATN